MSIRLQNTNNPRINDRSLSNPVIFFAVKLLVFITIFYIASFYIMSYQWWSWYMMPFYLFPLPQLWWSAKIGNRNCFKWQYQILLWPQSIIVPIFVKGYNDNFLQ